VTNELVCYWNFRLQIGKGIYFKIMSENDPLLTRKRLVVAIDIAVLQIWNLQKVYITVVLRQSFFLLHNFDCALSS
jgi:hypothetical protein